MGSALSATIDFIPALFFGVGVAIYYKVASGLIISALAPFVLFVSLIKQTSILNTIEFPRKIYYRYNVQDGVIVFLKRCNSEISRFFLFGFIGLNSFLFVKLFGEFRLIYAIGAVALCLLVFNCLCFCRILKVWGDERESRAKPKRNYAKISKLILLAFVLGYSNLYFHGHIIDNNDRFFRYVKEGNLKELQQNNIEKIVNTLVDGKSFYLLHTAALFDRKEIIQFLIENKADLNKKTVDVKNKKYFYRNGMTALHLALDVNHSKLAKMLIEKGANINIVSSKGYTPLSIAAFRCNPYLMKELIAKGADINHQTIDGDSPLHLASLGRCETGIAYLLKEGADKELKNKKGKTYIELIQKEIPSFYDVLQFSQEELY